MDIIRKEFFYKSSDMEHNIFACIWCQKGQTHYKGIVQIAHGMSEHILRYQQAAIYLVKQGYLVCGNDHLGHGQSVNDETELGYFGEGDENCKYLTQDMYGLMKKMKTENPDLKYVILGHSMGSFLARAFVCHHGDELDGAVFMGTSSGHIFIDAAIGVASENAKHKGGKTRGGNINKLMADLFNVRCFPIRTTSDWICSDREVVNEFLHDKKCAFMFTYLGYKDLFTLLKNVNVKAWYETVPKHLPIFLISGANDPVGDYGKGVKKVYEHLVEHGVKNVKMKIFKRMRHEVLNEKGKCLVYRELSQWLDQI